MTELIVFFFVLLIDFLKTAFFMAVITFFLALIGVFFFRLQSNKKWSWFIKAFVSLLVVVFIVGLIAYVYPLTLTQQSSLTLVESSFETDLIEPTFFESLTAGLTVVGKFVLTVFFFTLCFVPLLFVGSLVFNKLEKQGFLLKLFVSAFAVCFLVLILFLLFPWLLAGLIYFFYF
ncbi:MAG: hypothetical protein ABH821_01000 [archaeon]